VFNRDRTAIECTYNNVVFFRIEEENFSHLRHNEIIKIKKIIYSDKEEETSSHSFNVYLHIAMEIISYTP